MAAIVIGRFPPPVDGQALATERLASLLEPTMSIVRVDMEPPVHAGSRSPAAVRRGVHFWKLRRNLGQRLAQSPGTCILWTSISPDVLGHLRDMLITVPNFDSSQRVFAIVHRGNFHRLFESPLTSGTATRLVEQVEGFVFLTDRLSERCARWIPEEKRFVIPNTIDDQLIFSDDEILEKQENRVRRERMSVLFVGHMLPSKGYLDVLEAIRLLRENGLTVVGHFVGRWNGTEDRAAFNQLLRRQDLSEIVTHHGPVSDRGIVKELYRQADVLLLPSYYRNEAQPLVIIEALNAGTPVISTRHAGIPEMIREDREGFFVPSADPRALSQAIKRLTCISLWQRTSFAARERYLTRFAPSTVRGQWERLMIA